MVLIAAARRALRTPTVSAFMRPSAVGAQVRWINDDKQHEPGWTPSNATDSQADVRADQAAKETGGAKELQKETAEYFNKEGKASEEKKAK